MFTTLFSSTLVLALAISGAQAGFAINSPDLVQVRPSNRFTILETPNSFCSVKTPILAGPHLLVPTTSSLFLMTILARTFCS
jgi:hypothetical protein